MGSVMDQPRPWEPDYYGSYEAWRKSPYYRSDVDPEDYWPKEKKK